MVSPQTATPEMPLFTHDDDDRELRSVELMDEGNKAEDDMLANDVLLCDSGKSVNIADESMAVIGSLSER